MNPDPKTNLTKKRTVRKPVGRFAPSPTGPLHFGSLVAAVASYCRVRQAGGRWLVRIEDLDPPRTVSGAADEILRSLERFGFEWDGDVVWQSRRSDAYDAALEQLREVGRLYSCACSRREIIASAPHQGEDGPVYPGTCRDGLAPGRQARAWRLRVGSEPIVYDDLLFGRQSQQLARDVGDFVLKRADGLFAYQLAVVVDDAAASVTQVVRGADLLASTPRQIYLYQCLGESPPEYLHLPLVLGADGEKLSKRHGAVLAGDGSSAMAGALEFLGAPPPAVLQRASGKELLAWGVAHLDLGRVSPVHRVMAD